MIKRTVATYVKLPDHVIWQERKAGEWAGGVAALSARIKLKNVNDKEQWKITENITKAAAAATKQGRQWRRRAGGIKREINVEKEREKKGGGEKAARTACNLSQVKCTAHVHVRGKAQLAWTARRVTQGEAEGEREDKR